MRTLDELTRPNILRLKPYSSARDEYKGKQASVFLDANENPYNHPYNRYPDPLQTELKARLAEVKGVSPECIFLGNGSDEAIDLVYRAFCEPRVDNVVAIEPTYGMYEVCADMNGVDYRKVRLDDAYDFRADDMLRAADGRTKAMFLCSPNNPTGNSLRREEIETLLCRFDGLVIVDEAYIDFSSRPSLLGELAAYPRLIVLQTFSKAWGCAGIRLGMAFAAPDIIRIFNKIKYPYNVNLLTQREALDMLGRSVADVERWVAMLLAERGRVMEAFRALSCCREVFPTDANFFLARMTDADGIYAALVSQGIIVRNRSHVALCDGCLRVTIGTPGENDALLNALRKMN